MGSSQRGDDPDRWARLRFAIIGPLLAAPPARGELQQALRELAAKSWRHPVTGVAVQFSVPTVERWFYAARSSPDPVSALRRQRRADAGRGRCLSTPQIQALRRQYQDHTGWTVQLHYDNLVALACEQPELAPMPSYATVRRFMKARGWQRKRRPKRQTPGTQQAAERLERCEVRSFEAEYADGLWHLDFHHGSRPVLTPTGQWVTPIALGVLDDHSRRACHLQWYLAEATEELVHGLCQGFQKVALPRALMTDNGGAMQAEEFVAGLHTLGIVHEPTLPYSPYQNAKQEVFWATVEGRLMAMLEAVEALTLDRLNEITQVWVHGDYQQAMHAEIATSPLQRYRHAPQVGRACPDSHRLRQAFRRAVKRRQRRSDGTVALEGKRFEIPSRYRHLEQPLLRYARWDLSHVELLDPHTREPLCPLYPIDKAANAEGQRRRLDPDASSDAPLDTPTGEPMPPLLRKLLAEFAATGKPPAYLPQHARSEDV
jgi:transposase InsO family protein